MPDGDAGPSPFGVRFDVADDGAPRFACKEAFDVAGHPADAGHPAFAAMRGARGTSRAVAALRDAGYALVGKTVASELLVSGLGENSRIRMPLNAVDPERVTGGSSAGCAVAVARGEVEVSLATDTAGSARIPAACHGIVGLALAGSRRWLRDAASLAPTLDQLGILGRAWEDVARVAHVLGLPDAAGKEGPLLVPWDVLEGRCTPEHLERFRAWERALPAGTTRAVAAAEAFDATDAHDRELGGLALRELAAHLAGFLAAHGDEVDPDVRRRLETRLVPGRPTPREWRRAWGALRAWRRGAGRGTLLLPTLPCAVPRLGRPVPRAMGALTHYTNLMAESALSLPVDGIELSVQLVAPRWEDLVAGARRLIGGV